MWVLIVIPRSKSMSSSVNLPYQYERANPPYTSWTTIESGSFLKEVHTKSISGFDIENYHSRKRRGDLLPLTPFEQFIYDRVHGAGTYTVQVVSTGRRDRYKDGQMQWVAMVGLPSANWDVDLTAMRALAAQYDTGPLVQACAAKIYAQGWDVLTFLKELPKTVALFNGLADRWKRLASNLDVGQSWLEYRYGWRTLLFDIQDATKAIQSLEDQRKRFSDRVGYSEIYQVTDNYTYSSSFWNMSYTSVKNYNVSVRGSVVADIQPPKFRFNPILTGWETIKYSFIVDWFLTVGPWLESLSFLATASSYTAAGGILIQGSRTTTITSASAASSNNTFPVLVLPGPSTVSVEYALRNPQNLSLRPFVVPNLDVYKVSDLVAILTRNAKGIFSGTLRL
jgi:hypothetical protein